MCYKLKKRKLRVQSKTPYCNLQCCQSQLLKNLDQPRACQVLVIDMACL